MTCARNHPIKTKQNKSDHTFQMQIHLSLFEELARPSTAKTKIDNQIEKKKKIKTNCETLKSKLFANNNLL